MVGTQIGHYRVTRPIGDGGIGAVYEATHQQIGRRVAVKILRAEHARDKETVTRLFNEARAVNRIEHPGLVQIFDCDQLSDGRAYLVMEFIAGETLSARLARSGGRLAEIDAMRIAYQLASILEATHAAGIVHRDLKPGNIMLSKDPDVPGGERVKLLDFGIAKLQPAGGISGVGSGPDAGLTRPGMVFGTPTYMSPEQCRGAGEVDGRSDVYSLGVILFQMIAGRPPFPGEGVGVVALHLCEDPPPLAELAPTVSKAVAGLVASMLAKKREERPSMTEVAATLRPRIYDFYQSSRNIQIPPLGAGVPGQSGAIDVGPISQPSTLGRMAVQKVERRRLPLVVGTLLSVGLLVGSGLLTMRLLTPKPAPRQVPSVRWLLSTDPSGATVRRIADGQVLGSTPFAAEHPSAPGSIRVRIEKDGYRARELPLDTSRDQTLTFRLDREPPPVAAAPPEEKPAPAPTLRKPSRPARPGRPASREPVNASKETKVVDD